MKINLPFNDSDLTLFKLQGVAVIFNSLQKITREKSIRSI